jgi:hypothetical protein
MKQLIKVKINRKKWLRGGKNGEGNAITSKLRNCNGEKCCLGFVCTTLGIKSTRLTGIFEPQDLRSRKIIPGLTKKGFFGGEDDYINTRPCRTAININDGDMPDEKREIKLKKIANKMGYNFEFIN